MSDDIQKLKEYFEQLSQSLNYSKERKNEVYNTVVRPLEIIIKAGEDPKSEESKIIKRFVESIFYNLFYIDESVVTARDLGEDQMVTYDEQTVYEKSNVNSSYLKAIAKHIPQIPNFSNTGIKVEDVILQEKESRKSDFKKVEINFEWLKYLLGKYFQSENFMEFQISGISYVNFLLNLKLYFTQESFPQLMDLFKITNNLGTDDKIVLIKYLIKKYQDALSPDNQVSVLNTIIFEDKGLEICKKTSDEYSRAMLNVLQSKLFYLQGIKEDIKKVGKPEDIPRYKNVKVVEKTIDKHLDYLKTKHKGDVIISNEEYEILKEYTVSLLINDEVPFIATQFRKIDISNQTIIYSYYQIQKELFDTRRIKDTFIDFLKATFSQLKNYDKSTLKTKFSVKPKRFPY